MKWRLLRRKLWHAQLMSDGCWMIESGSPAYEAAMDAVRWGKPRGYAVTWRQKTMKPHLYPLSRGIPCA